MSIIIDIHGVTLEVHPPISMLERRKLASGGGESLGYAQVPAQLCNYVD